MKATTILLASLVFTFGVEETQAVRMRDVESPTECERPRKHKKHGGRIKGRPELLG